MKRTISFVLVSCFALPVMAKPIVKQSEGQLVSSIYREDILPARALKIKQTYERIKSWDEFQEEGTKNLSDKDKAIFLAKIGQLKGHPFRLPTFTINAQGWTLELSGHKLIVDMMGHSLKKKNKSFDLNGKSLEEVMDWIEGTQRKTSFIPSWVLEEAHADPVTIGALVLLGAGSVYTIGKFLWDAKDNCNKYNWQVQNQLKEKLSACIIDKRDNLISDQTEGFITQMRAFINDTNIKSGQSQIEKMNCKESMKSHFLYATFGSMLSLTQSKSCLEDHEIKITCDLSEQLGQCLTELSSKIPNAIKEGERSSGKDLPSKDVPEQGNYSNGGNKQ